MTIETLASTGFTPTHTGLAGIDTRHLKAMRNAGLRACFKRMEDTAWRQEYVATVRGRQYYNDAASRNINATWYAVENNPGGVIWITCGIEDEVDYSCMLSAVHRKVRMILVLGPAKGLRKAFGSMVPQIEECATMAEAVKRAYYYDSPDVTVLFSPATNDAAHSTAELAEAFENEVNEL